MNARDPAMADDLIQRSAREGEPALVEKGAASVGSRDPDHYRRRVGHVPEALFTFAQRAFGLFTFGDVEIETRKACRPALVVENHGPFRQQPVNTSARPDHPEFSVPEMRGFDALPHVR